MTVQPTPPPRVAGPNRISALTIQRRHAELGRIRLGIKVPSGRGSRPEKLDRFRFTSTQRRYIDDLARLYGGEARSWTNGKREEYEVITDATSIPVIVVRNSVSQSMETWSGGGCVHRCDGERDRATDELCDPENPLHVAAKPTTRLSVMLTDLQAVGVWRLESHGWNAAAELPEIAELASMVATLVPARLILTQRSSLKDGKTSHFVVPVIDIEVAPRRLAEIVGGATQQAAIGVAPASGPAIGAAPAPDIAPPADAPRGDVAVPEWIAAITAATTIEELEAIAADARSQRVADRRVIDAFRARNDEIVAAIEQARTAAPADPIMDNMDDEPVDGDVEPDETGPGADVEWPTVAQPLTAQPTSGTPAVDAWDRLVTVAGERGMDIDAVDDLLEGLYPGVEPGQHTDAQLLAAIDSLPAAPR